MKKTFIIFLLFFHIFLFAQSKYKYNHFTTDDGLPTNTIYAITEDKSGNIVLGTDNGLSIFDGNDFKNYNVKDGLQNPFIVSVMTDEKGVVWFINYGANIQKYDKNKIITTSINANQTNGFLNTQEDLYLFTSQNRCANNSYYNLRIKKNNFQIIKLEKDIFAKSKIAPPILVQDNKEIKLKNNFLVFDNKKIAIPNAVSLLHKVIFRKNDVLLLDENYLFIEDFNSKILQKIKLPIALSEKPIYKYDFVVDNQNNVWLNIQDKGFFILKNYKWASINNDLGLNATDYINFLFCDSKGKMWIATNEKGLYCVSTTLISYYNFANANNYFNGFAFSQDNKSIFISSKFCLYNYQNNNLNLLKKSSSEIKIGTFKSLPVFYSPNTQPTIWDNNLKMLLVNGKQILKFDATSKVYLKGINGIQLNNKDIRSNFKEKIKSVVAYKNEFYFNNSEKISIRTFNEKEFKIKRELKLNIKGFIQDFTFIKDTLWIATESKVYKAFNEKIVDSIATINDCKVQNVNNIIFQNDAVFLCSITGLFILKNNQNRVLNKYNFLPNNEVYNASFYEDNLFVATKDGLAKIRTDVVFEASEIPKLELFYNSKIISTIKSSSSQEAIKINLKIQNFNAIKNQIIQYKIDNFNWVTSQTKTLFFQSLAYGNHTLLVRVKDVNSAWAKQSISIYKSYPFYLKWWFILVSNLILLLIIYLIYRNRIKKIKAKKQLDIATNNRVAELRQSALSAMMNPHFVFNSLNAIQYFVNSNQPEKSSEHLAKLARLVRLFLSQASEPFISLSDEIKRLKLYLELEQVRFMNFEFTFNIDKNIDIYQTTIPNMIVQPFIENAILHGVSHLKENDGKIDLNFRLNQNVLTIEILDNGFGIAIDKPKNNAHISKGIAIITERIEILQESYPEKTFTIVQENAFSDQLRKGHKVIIVVTIF